jgi:hypothetical protein
VTINVLEVRYAATKEGPWSEPEHGGIWDDLRPEWSAPMRVLGGPRQGEWYQDRVVPYTCPERKPGTEVPYAAKVDAVATVLLRLDYFNADEDARSCAREILKALAELPSGGEGE